MASKRFLDKLKKEKTTGNMYFNKVWERIAKIRKFKKEKNNKINSKKELIGKQDKYDKKKNLPDDKSPLKED